MLYHAYFCCQTFCVSRHCARTYYAAHLGSYIRQLSVPSIPTKPQDLPFPHWVIHGPGLTIVIQSKTASTGHSLVSRRGFFPSFDVYLSAESPPCCFGPPRHCSIGRDDHVMELNAKGTFVAYCLHALACAWCVVSCLFTRHILLLFCWIRFCIELECASCQELAEWAFLPILCGYSSYFEREDSGVTNSLLKPLMSSSGSHHAILQYHMALLGDSNTIWNDLEKSVMYIYVFTPNELVNLELFYI